MGAKNQELDQKLAGMEKRTVESVRQVKTAAQNAITEKDKVIQEMAGKLKKAEETLQLVESRSLNVDSQNATIRELEEKCRRLQSNQQESGNAIAKQYEAKLRATQEQMVKLQQSLQVSKGQENGMKVMEEKLKASQNQISTLLRTLKTKE